MRVFLSWSGKSGEAVATALEAFLLRMGMGVRPWRSGSGLDPGTRWESGLARALEDIKFGIVCVTADALLSPYVNFESGALSRALDDETRLIPLLIGKAEIPPSHPLSVFQRVQGTQAGVFDLVRELHKQVKDSPLPTEMLESQMSAFWEDLEKALSEAAKADGAHKPRTTKSDTDADPTIVDQKLLDYMRSISQRLSGIEQRMDRRDAASKDDSSHDAWTDGVLSHVYGRESGPSSATAAVDVLAKLNPWSKPHAIAKQVLQTSRRQGVRVDVVLEGLVEAEYFTKDSIKYRRVLDAVLAIRSKELGEADPK